jgi:hypothetical protein
MRQAGWLPVPRRRIEHDEHKRLHRDTAGEIPDSQRRMAAECRRAGDREFGQGAGEPEGQHLADGVCEVEPPVEDVGGLRQVDTGEPGGDACRDDDDELWRCAAKLTRRRAARAAVPGPRQPLLESVAMRANRSRMSPSSVLPLSPSYDPTARAPAQLVAVGRECMTDPRLR